MKHLHRSFTALIMLSMILGLFSMPAFSSDVALAQTDGDVQSTTGPLPPPAAMQSLSESVGYSPVAAHTIGGVPAYEWQHGCGPTAAGMVIGYWDGYYDDRGAEWLIDGDSSTQTLAANEAMASEASTPSHYSDYSLPLDDDINSDYILKDNSSLLLVGDRHVNDSIADFMQTSWSSRGNEYGWSYLSDMPLAMLAYAKMRNPGGYTVASSTVVGMSWTAYQAEINAGRPVVLLVDTPDFYTGEPDGKTDHFITAVGYDIASDGTKMYAAYITWDTNLHWFTFHPMSKTDPWGIHSGTTFKITTALPAVPVLVSPATNLVTNNTAPELDWNPSANAYSYNLQVSTSSSFSGELETDEFSYAYEPTYSSFSGLSNGIKYYWRVRSQNISGVYSAWSVVRNFTVDTSAPDAPLLSLPVDNGPAIIGAPTFSWKASVGAAKYQFAYGTDAFPTDTVSEPEDITGFEGNSPEQSTLTYKPATMPTGLHYWSVRAKDVAGNWGFWSASFRVTTTAPKPAVPVLDLPATNLITSDNTPNLSWKSVPYGVDYHLQVSTSSTFSILVAPAFEATISGLNLDTDSLADGKYYWRVQAINATGSSAFSASRYFTVDTLPPAPLLALPLHNGSSVGTPTFSWKASVGAAKYQFVYGTAPILAGTLGEPESITGFEAKSLEQTTLTYKPTILVPVGDHYWSVRAKDAAGNWGAWSASFKVTITAPKPAVPVLLYPLTNYFTKDDTPSLTWQGVPYGVTYNLQVSTSSTFSILVAPAFVGTTSGLDLNTSSLAEGKYYWRVQATNATGSSAFSAGRYFTVDLTAPDAPQLLLPLTSSIGTPTFSWKAPVGATKYQFAYDTTDTFTSAGIVEPYILGVELFSLESTALTHKPPTMPVGDYYWSARAKDAAGNWGPWSAGRLVTIHPPTPAVPVLNLPANDAKQDSTTAALSWLAAANANIYEVQVDNTAAFSNPVDFSYTSGVGELSHPFSPLAVGKWYWRVRAKNTNNVYSAWSASRYFTILPSFNTQFNIVANAEGWNLGHPGAPWVGPSGGNISTSGRMDWYTSSASYPATFTDFTYEARMKMVYVKDRPWRTNGYGLVVRGTPTFFGKNDWKTAYYFTIYHYYNDNDTPDNYSDDYGVACYEVAKISNGAWSYPIFNCSDVINFNDWNNLKVYANGTNLKFYINDNLMWSSSIVGPLSGRLGVLSWLDYEWYWNDYYGYWEQLPMAAPVYVDWATAGEPVLPTSALSQEVTTNQWPAGFPSPMQKNKGLK